MEGLSPEQRRGLIGDAYRAAGIAGLSHAQNPNLSEGLAAFMQAGRQTAVQGADYYRQSARQQQQDTLAQQRVESQIESSQALAEARRARLEEIRADTRRRLAAEGEREQNVAIAKQRLGEVGIDTSGLDDDGVLDAAADMIAQAVESKAAAAFPAPDPGLTTAQESYYGLANRQADLRARELDLRAGGQAPAPAGPAVGPADNGVDIAGSLERILAAAPADKREALRAEFERRSRTEDPVELLAKLNRMVGSLGAR